VRNWWRHLWRHEEQENHLDKELRFHIEERVVDLMRSGLSEQAARRRVRQEFGGMEQVKEVCRDTRPINYVDQLLQDLPYAIRMIAKSPGFAVIAIVTLALGIGANTAIFSTIDSVLVRPLPFADPDRLVMVWEDVIRAGLSKNTPAPGNFADWRQRNRTFTEMAATRGRSANLTSDGAPELVFGRMVTSNFFSVLGVPPLLGRTFTEEEDRTNAPVVVISHALWNRRYLADPAIVGKSIWMSGAKVNVIGVMPREFVFRQRDADYWIPIAFTAADLQERGNHFLNVIARLKPGVALEQARQDMSAVAAAMSREYRENRQLGANVVPLREELVGKSWIGLFVLIAASGCVLLIACANLASLLLARGVVRQREIAVRAALGANRERLLRQMITEGLALATAAGVLGIAIVPIGMRIMARLVPAAMPPTAEPALNLRLLGFALALSLLTGVLFSLIPAWQSARTSLDRNLKQGGRTGLSARGQRLRDVLVVAELALALVLLVGAGLMLQTMMKLTSVDVGFRTDRLLVARTVLPGDRYASSAARTAFAERILDSLRALPGVEGAAYGSTLPFQSGGNTSGYRIEGRTLEANDPGDALYRAGSDGYLPTLGVRLLEGRVFDRRDRAEAAPVLVVNESFARRYWPGESALGHRVTVDFPAPVWRTIVGVVADVRERGYEPDMKPTIYAPAQQQSLWHTSELIVRAQGDPLSLVPAVRRIIGDVDAAQPVSGIRTMEEILDGAVADRRQQMTLLGTFAGLALLLASIGIYGVLSYAVTQRRREIGLRMALGASAVSVVRMVVGRGMLLTGIGLAIGLTASWALTRLMKTLLYGLAPTDAVALTGASALLAAVALLASWIPARRASRVDPILALREE
jgi:putative ABC transport system permease protein